MLLKRSRRRLCSCFGRFQWLSLSAMGFLLGKEPACQTYNVFCSKVTVRAHQHARPRALPGLLNRMAANIKRPYAAFIWTASSGQNRKRPSNGQSASCQMTYYKACLMVQSVFVAYRNAQTRLTGRHIAAVCTLSAVTDTDVAFNIALYNDAVIPTAANMGINQSNCLPKMNPYMYVL